MALLAAELRQAIERLRSRPSHAAVQDIAACESATVASLRQRNRLLLDENRPLRQDLADLKAELALAYGRVCDKRSG